MRAVIAAALAASVIFASASPAEVREIKPLVIDNDDGGEVDTFIMWYTRVRNSGVPVHVRGMCVSACTIILWLPKDQVCIEPTASFGFHLFSVNGFPDSNGTDAYARRYYPAGIQQWLASKPALTPRVVYMSAAEAVESGAVVPCEASPVVPPSPLPPPTPTGE